MIHMQVERLAAQAGAAEEFLKALANRHRLMVLCQLNGGERSVGWLQEAVGLSQSALSQHLARLRGDGLVKTRREGQTIYYSLASPEAERLIGLLYTMFCEEACGPATTAK
jgi:DNA-binding transcriptional ArsR family regulator